jgi:hypothetical protein
VAVASSADEIANQKTCTDEDGKWIFEVDEITNLSSLSVLGHTVLVSGFGSKRWIISSEFVRPCWAEVKYELPKLLRTV